ncbi:MAG: hypothetical protein ACI4SS_04805, partial [Clostridia bacterium]
MKIKLLSICFVVVMLFSACGKKQAQKPENEVDNKVKTESDELSNVEIITDEAEIAADRRVVGAMLDCFKNLDYEGAMEYIRESDRELFDLENTSQRPLYDSLFAKLSYEFGDSFV